MPFLPSGEVTQSEVMEWAQEQAQFLTPTQNLVLWYLCINAWKSHDNPEGAVPGDVLSGRTALHRIAARTGLSKRAVQNALDALQDAGYVFANHKPGNGRSAVTVFWDAAADERREDYRAGVRDLPKAFQRPTRKAPERHLKSVDSDNIVPIRSGT